MLVRIDPKKSHAALGERAVFHFVRVDINHQCNPIPAASLGAHYGENEPVGRRTIESFEAHDRTVEREQIARLDRH